MLEIGVCHKLINNVAAGSHSREVMYVRKYNFYKYCSWGQFGCLIFLKVQSSGWFFRLLGVRSGGLYSLLNCKKTFKSGQCYLSLCWVKYCHISSNKDLFFL